MKKRYGALLAAFLLILAVCTYASNQIYRSGLPVVQTTETISTKLNYLWELSGALRHEETVEYALPVAASVVHRSVQVGDRVTAGQPLLQVDTEMLHLQWLQCKIDEEALEARVEKSESYTKELLKLQLIQLRETIATVEEVIGADGWIAAETDGIVLSMQTTRQAAPQVPLVTVGPDGGQKTITFALTKEQTAYCEPGTELEVTLVCGGESTGVTLTADRVLYNAERQGYQCVVSTDLALDMLDGQEVAAVLSAESVFYYYVIPRSAVASNNNCNASFYVLRQRETIMGTEYYAVLRTGYILEQNDHYTALSAAVLEPVIAVSSGVLGDGQVVLIDGELD